MVGTREQICDEEFLMREERADFQRYLRDKRGEIHEDEFLTRGNRAEKGNRNC